MGMTLSPQLSTALRTLLRAQPRRVGLSSDHSSSAHAGHGWPPWPERVTPQRIWDVGAACSIRGPCLPVLALSNWVPDGVLTRAARKWIRELVTGRRRSARYGFWGYRSPRTPRCGEPGIHIHRQGLWIPDPRLRRVPE